MTDTDNKATEAAEIAARTLSAAEILGSMDFVLKLAKKLAKAHPSATPAQIADAIATVFAQELAKMEKRLDKVEAIRAKYNTLKSAQPVVASTVDMIHEMSTLEARDFAAERRAKPKAKTNGKAADAGQAALPL